MRHVGCILVEPRVKRRTPGNLNVLEQGPNVYQAGAESHFSAKYKLERKM